MAMVGRALEQKHSLTDELQEMYERGERSREAKSRTGQPPQKEFDEMTGLQRSPSYKGVAQYFGGEEYTKMEAPLEEGGVKVRHARRYSGEMDPDAHLHASRVPKPVRWEPFVDPDAMAEAIAAAMAHEKKTAAASKRASASAVSAQSSSGVGVAAVLQEQLMAERARTAKVEAKLEAALQEVREASARAARAEAKLEMTEQMMARLENVSLGP